MKLCILGFQVSERHFLFPIKAVIYKPTTSHQNTPLQFTIELVDYNRSDFLGDISRQTLLIQNEAFESINDFEDDVMLNETIVDGNTTDYITDNNELNVTKNLEENNSNSTGDNYFDAINLEKLFEMFLNEHFDDDTSYEQILNFTVFLDFLNKTDSMIIGEQNFTDY